MNVMRDNCFLRESLQIKADSEKLTMNVPNENTIRPDCRIGDMKKVGSSGDSGIGEDAGGKLR